MKPRSEVSTTDLTPAQLMRSESRSLRILYIGCMGNSSRSMMAARALTELGHQLNIVPSEALDAAGERLYYRDPAFRVLSKIGYPPDRQKANQRAEEILTRENFDLVWVCKSLCLQPSVLELARANNPDIRIVFHSEDDMFARHNQSIWFRRTIPLYDVIFTHKSYNANAEELPSMGARKVVMIDKCFDRSLHKPIKSTRKDRERFGASVGFVGTFELDRAEVMLRLAETGIPIRIWGVNWESWIGKHPLLRVEGRILTGSDYVKALANTDINLGFLRRANRDLQTDRSIEIPACGAFMLAERTDEHLQLFEEGVEAEFFESLEELGDKIQCYTQFPNERRAIAAQGRARCISGGYSFRDRFGSMLDIATGDLS